MINWLIDWSLKNRVIVIAIYIALAIAGYYALVKTPIDAIPDLSDNQVIVFTDWAGRSPREVEDQVTYPLSVNLQGLAGVKAGLLHELVDKSTMADALRFAALIKALPLRLTAARPIDEAISSAGGVRFEAMDDALMLKALPGVFCAGEMLDWEAPTGGYLLSACFASGRRAGQGAANWARRAP